MSFSHEKQKRGRSGWEMVYGGAERVGKQSSEMLYEKINFQYLKFKNK